MTDVLTRDALLQRIQDAKVEWEVATALLTQEEQEQPVLDGWSVKDVIAHLMWHEQEMVGLVRERRLAGSELWQRPLQERNRAIQAQFRDLPLAEVREQARNAHEAMVKEIEKLGPDELGDTARWHGFPPEAGPGQIIAQNSYEHYRSHIADVKRYLSSLTR